MSDKEEKHEVLKAIIVQLLGFAFLLGLIDYLERDRDKRSLER